MNSYRVTLILRNGTELSVNRFTNVLKAKDFGDKAFHSMDVIGAEITNSDGSRLSEDDMTEMHRNL